MKRLESFDSFTQKQKVYYLKSPMCRKTYDMTDILSLITSIPYLITKIETYYKFIFVSEFYTMDFRQKFVGDDKSQMITEVAMFHPHIRMMRVSVAVMIKLIMVQSPLTFH